MDEYINKHEPIEEIQRIYCASCNNYNEAMCRACEHQDDMDIIEDTKAADVQPVKHGYWIPQGDDMWLCSNCKENIIYSMHESDRTEKQRYCCRCGAKLDLNSITYDRCSNYIDCDGSCFIDDTLCDYGGNIEKCKGR